MDMRNYYNRVPKKSSTSLSQPNKETTIDQLEMLSHSSKKQSIDLNTLEVDSEKASILIMI